MDMETYAAAIAKVKKMPDTAANSATRAEAAQAAAETAAETAQEYGYRFAVSGTTLVVGEGGD